MWSLQRWSRNGWCFCTHVKIFFFQLRFRKNSNKTQIKARSSSSSGAGGVGDPIYVGGDDSGGGTSTGGMVSAISIALYKVSMLSSSAPVPPLRSMGSFSSSSLLELLLEMVALDSFRKVSIHTTTTLNKSLVTFIPLQENE